MMSKPDLTAQENLNGLLSKSIFAPAFGGAASHFTEDVIAVSNTKLFPSFEMLAADVKAYYNILKEVNLAVWDEMFINVIDIDTALVTARFRYSFTDTGGEKTNLQGVWTALYIRRNGYWKIQLRHESFVTIEDQ
jgi:ketosteroid isomerase-like protein